MKLTKVFLMLAMGVSSSWATSITVLNNSFELPAQSKGGFALGLATNWVVTGTAGVFNPNTGANNGTNSFFNVPDPSQVLFVGPGAAGDVSQVLSESLLANTTYTLTYWVGRQYSVALSAYTVSLFAGATLLSSDSGGAPTAGNFVQRTITFNSGASSGGALKIDIAATGLNGGASGQADFDLITLDRVPTGSAPEPGSMTLLGMGIVAVALSRWRRKA